MSEPSCIPVKEDKNRSWEDLPDKYKAVVLKSYSESLVSISGLFAGFQSFVIENNRNEHGKPLPLFLLMISFGLNITICLISLINQNFLNAGIYTKQLINVIIASLVLFVISVCAFYGSLILFTFDIFYDTQSYYVIILFQSGVSIVLMITYLLIIEKMKCDYKCSKRINHMNFLLGFDKPELCEVN